MNLLEVVPDAQLFDQNRRKRTKPWKSALSWSKFSNWRQKYEILIFFIKENQVRLWAHLYPLYPSFIIRIAEEKEDWIEIEKKEFQHLFGKFPEHKLEKRQSFFTSNRAGFFKQDANPDQTSGTNGVQSWCPPRGETSETL